VVDAESFASGHSKAAVVLIEGDEVERVARHGGCGCVLCGRCVWRPDAIRGLIVGVTAGLCRRQQRNDERRAMLRQPKTRDGGLKCECEYCGHGTIRNSNRGTRGFAAWPWSDTWRFA
jgi:hypothetical protein